LNLLDSIQTYSCLGHCITRGISLRRQATIFRLRGAVRLGGASWDAPGFAGSLASAPYIPKLAKFAEFASHPKLLAHATA
jgi:hypothetical protein